MVEIRIFSFLFLLSLSLSLSLSVSFCSRAREEREKQTTSWKAFTYLIFPLRRFNRRWTLSLEVLFAVENLLVSVRACVRPSCTDSRISPLSPFPSLPFSLSHRCLPFLVSFHFFFFSTFFFLSLFCSSSQPSWLEQYSNLACYTRELLNFTGTGWGRWFCSFELIFQSAGNRCVLRATRKQCPAVLFVVLKKRKCWEN